MIRIEVQQVQDKRLKNLTIDKKKYQRISQSHCKKGF